MTQSQYVHGTDGPEQERLLRLNRLNNSGFLRSLPLRPSDRVLEVGCGLGTLARLVSESVPEGHVIGVERSVEQLRQAMSGPRLSLVRGDAHHLPFPDAAFDVAYCRWVLEHVRDPLALLREMFRVTRPGGQVLVEENDNSLQRYDPPCPRFDHVWKQFNVLQEKLGGDGHIGSKLYRLLRNAGFVEVRMMVHPHLYRSGTEEFACWVENEAAILQGAAAALIHHDLATSNEIEAALAELRGLIDCPDAASWFYFSQALARRPIERASFAGI
jgi:ubiquinone/menaquinone biosynthesis C-methylase UbiE